MMGRERVKKTSRKTKKMLVRFVNDPPPSAEKRIDDAKERLLITLRLFVANTVTLTQPTPVLTAKTTRLLKTNTTINNTSQDSSKSLLSSR